MGAARAPDGAMAANLLCLERLLQALELSCLLLHLRISRGELLLHLLRKRDVACAHLLQVCKLLLRLHQRQRHPTDVFGERGAQVQLLRLTLRHQLSHL